MHKKRLSALARAALPSARFVLALLLALGLIPWALHSQPVQVAHASATGVVISQLYGGGGNGGSTYRNDYIELFNAGSSPVSLSGWSVQYASATGTSWTNKTDLPAVTLQPGQYFLIQEAAGTGGSANLPTPDLTGAIAMGGTAGKVALVRSTTVLTGQGITDPTVEDFVGFGTTASAYEGTGPTPAPSNANAVFRASNGCTDSNNNASDFSAAVAYAAGNPRNTLSTLNPCTVTPPTLTLSPTTLTYSATQGGANPAAQSITVGNIAGASGTLDWAVTDDGTWLDCTPASGTGLAAGATTPVSCAVDITGLLATTYTATVTVTSSTAGVSGSPQTVAVTLTVTAPVVPPTLTVTPATLTYSATEGGANPAAQSITVGNIAGASGPLDWSVADGAAWLDCTPASGTGLAAGGTSAVSCAVDITGLLATNSPFTANVSITSSTAGVAGSPQTVAVTLNLAAPVPPTLTVTPATLTYNTNVGSNPAAQTITVGNLAGTSGPLDWSVTDTAAWLDCTPANGTGLAAGATATVSCAVTATGLTAAGSPYTTTVTVTSSTAGVSGSPQTVAVTLNVSDPCAATTRIPQIQGTGPAAALTGTQTTVGVVVGDYQTGGFRGYFIQDLTGDGNAATSDGIFVYSTAPDVNVGQVVRVTGNVTEYSGLTEFSTATTVTSCGTGSVAPTPVTLPVSSTALWEQYEGMLITVQGTLTVTEVYTLGRYGEVLLAPGRMYNYTHVHAPDAGFTAYQDLFARSTIYFDDGLSGQNPYPLYHPQPGGMTAPGDTLRGGWTITNPTGVLNYTASAYRIEPVDSLYEPHFNSAPNPRPTTAPSVGGTLTVAGMNVLNYFTTLGSGNNCGPSGTIGCRGASDASEFNRQRAKLINVIVRLDAAVVGLAEMENNATDGPVANLVNGLNTATAAGTYAYIATGPIGTDAIRVAIIYQPARVTPVGAYAILDSVAPFNSNTRPPLAQTFRENSSGELFTVVVNHFKSKGCGGASGANADQNDGQSCYTADRVLAANALTSWLATDPTGSGDPDFILFGDYNSYAMEAPITAITGAGYVDLANRFHGTNSYSYVYSGQWGYLDYAFASASLNPQVAGAEDWHINSDEPIVLDYTEDYKTAQMPLLSTEPYRTSDHDPVVVGLHLGTTVIVSTATPGGQTGGTPGVGIFDPALSKLGVLQAGGLGLPGETLTWHITATNRGTAAGTNVIVTDTLRSELRMNSAETDRGTVTISGQTVTFTIPSLNPGESVEMRIVTTVLSNPAGGVLVNDASLVGAGPGGNVTASTTGTVAITTSLPATGYEPQESDTNRGWIVWLFAGALVLALVASGWVIRTKKLVK